MLIYYASKWRYCRHWKTFFGAREFQKVLKSFILSFALFFFVCLFVCLFFVCFCWRGKEVKKFHFLKYKNFFSGWIFFVFSSLGSKVAQVAAYTITYILMISKFFKSKMRFGFCHQLPSKLLRIIRKWNKKAWLWDVFFMFQALKLFKI